MQYADETAELYAKLMLEGATSDMTVAVVSTPSVFMAVKNILVSCCPHGFYTLSPTIPSKS